MTKNFKSLRQILIRIKNNIRRLFGLNTSDKIILRPHKAAKQARADILYKKGCEFIAASILLKRQQGQSFPQIHLFLQGLEIILKSLLLKKNYDKYNSKLIKYRHNIPRLVTEVKKAYGIKNLDKSFDKELAIIYEQYKTNNLRYGSLLDIFNDVNSFSIKTLENKTYQLIKYIDHTRQNN